MKDKPETTEKTDEENVTEITAEALMDEWRTKDRERAEKRLADLDEISPLCAREIEEGKTCGHKLNRHDPCSLCACPGFVSEDGEETFAASRKLKEEHPDLYPA